MSDNNEEKAEETAVHTDNEEKTTTDEEQIDYNKEFEEQVEKFEAAEKNREGYNQRKANELEATNPDIQAAIDAGVTKALESVIPALKAELTGDSVDTLLDEFSGGDLSKRKLLQFHFTNSISATGGTLRERMENALLIAQKKTILKTQKEMAVAIQNRQGLSNDGQGGNQGTPVNDSYFSEEQLAELRAKGYDDAKIKRLEVNMRKLK